MTTFEIQVPHLGESVTSATLTRWYKRVGDMVQENDIVLELETDKVTLEVNAPTSGVLHQQSFNEGDVVNIGDILGLLAQAPQTQDVEETFTQELSESLRDDRDKRGEDMASVREQTTIQTAHQRTPLPTMPSLEVSGMSRREYDFPASPAGRKRMMENGLTPRDILGASGQGLILKEDVLIAREHERDGDDKPSNVARTERKPMSPLRKKIGERLKHAQNTAAILTTFNECDMSTVMALRKDYQDEFVKKYGTKLGFMSFFVKACIQALQEIPSVNASIEGDDMLYHNYYDIGVAVSAPQGLVVPVLRKADQLGLHEIEQAIAAFGEKARSNKLSMKDMSGGTFTISNGGVFGSLCSTPILNPPQSAILGMHKIQERPIAMNGQVVIRPMMYLALSYDHRLIDGREAVTFLVKIKNYIENPVRSLIGL